MASQLTSLRRNSPELQIPCTLSSTRISARFSSSIAMAPQPPLQPLSDPETAGCRIGNARLRRHVAVESHRKSNLVPLVSPDDQWGNLTVLFSAGALGIWSEKTKMGSALNGPLVSTLLGLAASNFGIIAFDALAFPIVMEFLLPLAYPMLLFRADLRRVMKPTVTLLLAFLLGSGSSSFVVLFLWIVGTAIGSLVALPLVAPSFGQVFWQIGALLMGMQIGGAFKYLGISDKPDISDAFDVDSSALCGGLMANNVIRAVYFTLLFAFASKVPPETTTLNDDVEKDTQTKYNNKFPVLQSVTSLVMSFAICKVGSYLTKYFRLQVGTMPAITAITVILATIFPKPFGYLAPSGEAMATILMQVFFVVVGARENIFVVNPAPHIFMFSLVQISFHFVITIGLGKWLGFDLKSLLIVSIGNVGGPTTVYGMNAANGWGSLIIPGMLAGILRIPVAGFITIGLLSICCGLPKS